MRTMTRQAHYLYVADLVRGKVVLEVGTDDGAGARFLAEHGAARVIGIDPGAVAVAGARARHSLSNLEFRQENLARIELEDGSIDCVIVPDGATLVRRRGILAELRRVLTAGGALVVIADAAERPGGVGGATFRDLVEKLSPLFAPVRMVAPSPLNAVALVGFAGDDDPVEPARVVLDRSLAQGALVTTEYLAVCGAETPGFDELTLIELPGALAREVTVVPVTDAVPHAVETDERTELVADLSRLVSAGPPPVPVPAPDEPAGPTPSELIATALERHAEHSRELEAVIAEARAESEELAEELERERYRTAERDRVLAAERARLDRLSGELAEVRDRAARAEGEVLRLQTDQAATDQRSGDLQDRLSLVETRRAELERDLEEAEEARATLEGKVAVAEAAADDLRRVLTAVPHASGSEAEAVPFGIAALRRVEAELGAVRAILAQLETGMLELEASLVHADEGDDGERRVSGMAIEIGVKDAELMLLNIGLSTLQRRLRDAVDTTRTTRDKMQDRSAAEMLALMDGLQRALSALA
ncbi:MAG TPA: methyltransferase domain-containing protein [Kofleriaceae bacterium]|nr:methyltransferase domain-containing protein [Kofleriaceae bacterium]